MVTENSPDKIRAERIRSGRGRKRNNTCKNKKKQSKNNKSPHFVWETYILEDFALKPVRQLLHQGISEPVFYGDLVYKFIRIVGKPNFSDQFKKIVKRYIRVGYNFDVMRQSACLVLNPITVYSYGFLFNCATVGGSGLRLYDGSDVKL